MRQWQFRDKLDTNVCHTVMYFLNIRFSFKQESSLTLKFKVLMYKFSLYYLMSEKMQWPEHNYRVRQSRSLDILFVCQSLGIIGDEVIIFNFSIGMGKAKMMPVTIISRVSLQGKNVISLIMPHLTHFTYFVDKTVMVATHIQHFCPFLRIFKSEFLIQDSISQLIVTENEISICHNLSLHVDT